MICSLSKNWELSRSVQPVTHLKPVCQQPQQTRFVMRAGNDRKQRLTNNVTGHGVDVPFMQWGFLTSKTRHRPSSLLPSLRLLKFHGNGFETDWGGGNRERSEVDCAALKTILMVFGLKTQGRILGRFPVLPSVVESAEEVIFQILGWDRWAHVRTDLFSWVTQEILLQSPAFSYLKLNTSWSEES